MPVDRKLLFRVLQSARGKPLTVEEVLMRARLDVGAQPHVRRELRAMARDGLIQGEGKRFLVPREETAAPPVEEPRGKGRGREKGSESTGFVPPEEAVKPVVPLAKRSNDDYFVGTLRKHRDGYGFIANLEGGDDLFVPPQVMGDALDGDLVRARKGPGRDERPVARTLEVLEHRRQYAVGTYRIAAGRGGAWVEPRDEALPQIQVRLSEAAADGDVVRVRLDKFGEGTIFGSVVSRLGLPGDPDVEVLSVAYGEGFADIFPADVILAADVVPPEVRTEDKAGRRDLTGIDLVTIDGEDARDFDDAVFVERTSSGYRLVVAIADVTAYVTPGNALDREAYKRATSVYFPQHVLPMLPERLSNGICSLNPHVERLCMVADMMFDASGTVRDAEIFPGVMRSKARCTYTKVAKILEGGQDPDLAHVHEQLLLAGELAKKLTKKRMERGAIDFDIPEGYVKLGPDNEVIDIDKRPRNDAHRLVEEFMLAANEAVARYFESRELPTVYRIHGQPKEEKLRAFADLAQRFGYVIPIDAQGRVSNDALNDFLARVEGRPEQRALNQLLLRSMMQAVYSSENIGHFGLAAESYLHFTSPIRRYPDLIVHRLLKEHWARGGKLLGKGEREKQAEDLEQVAVHCSERERASTSAEREIDAYYAAKLMMKHVGERFPGTVASVAEFGLFIEIDKPYVQGLIRAETIGDNPQFDPEEHRLSFGPSRSFVVGDRVEVEIASSDPVLRRIDLKLVEKGRTFEQSAKSRLLTDAIDELKRKRREQGAARGAKPSGRPGGKPGGGGGKGGPKGGGRGAGGGGGGGGGGRGKQEKKPKQRHQRRGR